MDIYVCMTIHVHVTIKSALTFGVFDRAQMTVSSSVRINCMSTDRREQVLGFV